MTGVTTATGQRCKLDALIDDSPARGHGDPAATAREAQWRASEAAYHERKREENLRAWIQYFEGLARSHRELSERNEARAKQLQEPQEVEA